MVALGNMLAGAGGDGLNYVMTAFQTYLGASSIDIFQIASQGLVSSLTKSAHIDPLEHYVYSCHLVVSALGIMSIIWDTFDDTSRSSIIEARGQETIAAGCRAILRLYDLSSPFDDRTLTQIEPQSMHPDVAVIKFVCFMWQFDPDGSDPIEIIQLAAFLWARFTSRPHLELGNGLYVSTFLPRVMKHWCDQRPPTMPPIFSAYFGGEEGFASSILETFRRAMEDDDGNGTHQEKRLGLLKSIGSVILQSMNLGIAGYTTLRYTLLRQGALKLIMHAILFLLRKPEEMSYAGKTLVRTCIQLFYGVIRSQDGPRWVSAVIRHGAVRHFFEETKVLPSLAEEGEAVEAMLVTITMLMKYEGAYETIACQTAQILKSNGSLENNGVWVQLQKHAIMNRAFRFLLKNKSDIVSIPVLCSNVSPKSAFTRQIVDISYLALLPSRQRITDS